MDNLTHTAIGLFLSRAGFNRLTPRATAILLLAANAPDIDGISAAAGSLNYLHYHRHLTHSIAALPAMALLAVVLVRYVGRKPIEWGGAMLAAGAGVASHLTLDWTNIYGIRLLLPFSEEWFRADITGVIDLWIWAALMLGMAGPFLSRLVGSEIGAPASGRVYGRGWAIFTLGLVLFYDVGRAYLHARAAASLDARMYDGSAPLQVFASPSAANPLHWRGVVETADAFSVHEINLAREFDPAAGMVFHKPDPDPAIDAARATETMREFLRFSQLAMIRVVPLPEPEGAKRVEAIDLRFGSPVQPGFMASVAVDGALRVLESQFQFGRIRPR